MNPKIIKTNKEYESALKRIEQIFFAKRGTPEHDELLLLVLLVEVYEDKKFVLENPDPIDAIRFCMEQQGLKAKDLVPFIGSASKVSEVLSRKRPLSINMIRNLSKGLGISLEVLVG